MKARQDPRSQVPPLGEVVLDHLGLFVEDIENAPTRLEALGFTLTPVALHKSASGPQGTATLSGTANRCAMFGEGYLEILGPRVDTLLSQQLLCESQQEFVSLSI